LPPSDEHGSGAAGRSSYLHSAGTAFRANGRAENAAGACPVEALLKCASRKAISGPIIRLASALGKN
jgi:hypothetical protein